jgi:hypothetical protein
MDDACKKIQYNWRVYIMKKEIMKDLCEELWIRERNVLGAYMLIDVWIDDHVDTLVDLYNQRAKRLNLITFEDYSQLQYL